MAITQVPPLVLVKGALTFVPGLLAFYNRFRRRKAGTVSARFCYAVDTVLGADAGKWRATS